MTLQEWKSEAEAGVTDKQNLLGKYSLHIYEVSKTGPEATEHARTAVDWLSRASRQGDEEATELLRHCLEEEIGTCHFILS